MAGQLASRPSLHITLLHAEGDPPERLSEILARLGHAVVARQLDLDPVGGVMADDDPDVAIASLALVSTDALDLLAQLIDGAICPVIAVLRAASPDLVRAATFGCFDVIADDQVDDLSAALDLTLQRFDAYRAQHGASGPRAAVEQAVGILMVHDAVAADQARELLRQHAEATGQTLLETAAALVSARSGLARIKSAH